MAARPRGERPVTAALSEWPGHMALVVGNGGLHHPARLGGRGRGAGPADRLHRGRRPRRTRRCRRATSTSSGRPSTRCPSTWAATRRPRSTRAPSSRSTGRAAATPAWPRARCKKVEDILGRKSAMMMFSPDHTVFEFMITNSRLTPERDRAGAQGHQLLDGRLHLRRACCSPQGKVDVACLWEPDVTLALDSRPGLAPPVLDRRRHRAGGRRAAGAPGAARPSSPRWRRRWPGSGSPGCKQAEADQAGGRRA